MNVIEQQWRIDKWPVNAMSTVEEVGRDAYQSQKKAGPGSDEKFCEMIVKRSHLGLLEWEDVRVRIITNRAVSHELVRHRHASFLQESQRYVNYKTGISFIRPYWSKEHPEAFEMWKNTMIAAETDYAYMVEGLGLQPQEARDILPNATATIINMKHNLRGWREIFVLRTAPGVYPPTRLLMTQILNAFAEKIPVFFKDLLDAISANYLNFALEA